MRFYSNEIVFRGHPDKVCDQISDALLDAFISGDKGSRCGIETMGGKGKVFITGEVTSNTYVEVEAVARRVLQDVGYPADKLKIINNLGMQSEDIARGTNDEAGGAGDNGMMFGFATTETTQLLPKAMVILQQFSRYYDSLRKRDPRFLPDGKAQLTGMYDDEMRLKGIKTATICYQNTEKYRKETDLHLRNVLEEIALEHGVAIDRFFINPTGRFEVGGFEGDAGLTGRKIVVDTYHGFAKVGGGAFSGKDPTKVDRSGAYKAREIAKSVVTCGLADWCEVQLSYAIGIAWPLAIYIDTNMGEIIPSEAMFDECQPRQIIKDLNLLNVNYEALARFGHFF